MYLSTAQVVPCRVGRFSAVTSIQPDSAEDAFWGTCLELPLGSFQGGGMNALEAEDKEPEVPTSRYQHLCPRCLLTKRIPTT